MQDSEYEQWSEIAQNALRHDSTMRTRIVEASFPPSHRRVPL